MNDRDPSVEGPAPRSDRRQFLQHSKRVVVATTLFAANPLGAYAQGIAGDLGGRKPPPNPFPKPIVTDVDPNEGNEVDGDSVDVCGWNFGSRLSDVWLMVADGCGFARPTKLDYNSKCNGKQRLLAELLPSKDVGAEGVVTVLRGMNMDLSDNVESFGGVTSTSTGNRIIVNARHGNSDRADREDLFKITKASDRTDGDKAGSPAPVGLTVDLAVIASTPGVDSVDRWLVEIDPFGVGTVTSGGGRPGARGWRQRIRSQLELHIGREWSRRRRGVEHRVRSRGHPSIGCRRDDEDRSGRRARSRASRKAGSPEGRPCRGRGDRRRALLLHRPCVDPCGSRCGVGPDWARTRRWDHRREPRAFAWAAGAFRRGGAGPTRHRLFDPSRNGRRGAHRLFWAEQPRAREA